MSGRTIYNSEQLASYADQGLTLAEMSEELGVSKESVRMALMRRGLKSTRLHNQTIRQRALGMRPSQAVTYLLEQLELLVPHHSAEALHPVDDKIPGLTPSERRIAIALWDAGGRTVQKEAILTAKQFGIIGDAPSVKIIDVMICKLRRKLPDDITIETHWGFGFKMMRPTEHA